MIQDSVRWTSEHFSTVAFKMAVDILEQVCKIGFSFGLLAVEMQRYLQCRLATSHLAYPVFQIHLVGSLQSQTEHF